GGWALFANRDHAAVQAWTAALAQGVMSGAITLVLKRFLEWASVRLSGPAAALVPPLASATAIFLLLTGVHRLMGTPEILATIAVPFTVSTLYAFVYCATLVRGRRAAAS
ncbi:MAG: hypothetical protein ACXWVJ_03240, partial [Caulobacteraceae bacterium]